MSRSLSLGNPPSGVRWTALKTDSNISGNIVSYLMLTRRGCLCNISPILASLDHYSVRKGRLAAFSCTYAAVGVFRRAICDDAQARKLGTFDAVPRYSDGQSPLELTLDAASFMPEANGKLSQKYASPNDILLPLEFHPRPHAYLYPAIKHGALLPRSH